MDRFRTMKLKMAFVMDPIQTINTDKDTTFVLMLESQLRGHQVLYTELKDLFVQNGKAWANVSEISLRRAHDYYSFGKTDTLPLEGFDVVWMRKDPPFNLDYIYSTYILGLLDSTKALVINNPKGIRESNEKLYTLNFPQLIPPTMVTKDMSRLKKFLAEIGGGSLGRPHAEAIDSNHFTGLGEPDHDRRNTRHVDEIALRDAERDACGHAGIDGIAPGFENEETCVRGLIVGGSHHVARAGQHVAVPGDAFEADDIAARRHVPSPRSRSVHGSLSPNAALGK